MILEKMFKDCFNHLGKEALYNGELNIRVLIKEPDRCYEIGDIKMIGQMAFFEVSIDDLPSPEVGGNITVDNTVYKIFSEPLKNSFKNIWEIKSMVM